MLSEARNKPFIIAGVVLVVLVAVFFSYRAMPRAEAPRPVDRSTETNWMRQKAQEAQGDLSRLSAEDQQKVRAVMGGQAESGFRMLLQSKPN